MAVNLDSFAQGSNRNRNSLMKSPESLFLLGCDSSLFLLYFFECIKWSETD